MIKHVGHLSPGRYHGHHHESTEPLATCSVCGRDVVRWSLMKSKVARDWWIALVRKGLL